MLDIVIIVVLLSIMFIGYKTGFIRTAYQLIASVISLVVAFLIYPIVSNILKLTPLYTGIKSWNYEAISSLEVVSGVQSQADIIHKGTNWLPGFIGENIIKNNNPEVYKLLGVSNISEYVSTYITDICISALAILITWLIIKIALSFFVGALDLIAKLPLLSTANKVGGLLLGGIKGLFTIWMIFLVTPFMEMIPGLNALQGLIDTSYLGKLLYENNLILQYLQNLFL